MNETQSLFLENWVLWGRNTCTQITIKHHINCILFIILYYTLRKIKGPFFTACLRQELGRKKVPSQCALLGPIGEDNFKISFLCVCILDIYYIVFRYLLFYYLYFYYIFYIYHIIILLYLDIYLDNLDCFAWDRRCHGGWRGEAE